jgi:hypothetical protein
MQARLQADLEREKERAAAASSSSGGGGSSGPSGSAPRPAGSQAAHPAGGGGGGGDGSPVPGTPKAGAGGSGRGGEEAAASLYVSRLGELLQSTGPEVAAMQASLDEVTRRFRQAGSARPGAGGAAAAAAAGRPCLLLPQTENKWGRGQGASGLRPTPLLLPAPSAKRLPRCPT